AVVPERRAAVGTERPSLERARRTAHQRDAVGRHLGPRRKRAARGAPAGRTVTEPGLTDLGELVAHAAASTSTREHVATSGQPGLRCQVTEVTARFRAPTASRGAPHLANNPPCAKIVADPGE